MVYPNAADVDIFNKKTIILNGLILIIICNHSFLFNLYNLIRGIIIAHLYTNYNLIFKKNYKKIAPILNIGTTYLMLILKMNI